jgi:uncharacterized protein (UPF0303 family)
MFRYVPLVIFLFVFSYISTNNLCIKIRNYAVKEQYPLAIDIERSFNYEFEERFNVVQI